MTLRTVPLPAAIDAYAYIDGAYRPASAVAFNIDADDGEATDFVVIAEIDGDIVPCVVPFLRPARGHRPRPGCHGDGALRPPL